MQKVERVVTKKTKVDIKISVCDSAPILCCSDWDQFTAAMKRAITRRSSSLYPSFHTKGLICGAFNDISKTRC